ncbi:MAG: hypothetical protein F4123_07605 [Gemmatimonadetes bacterium]|nr:hypothetical protein [Gemmatimonadota bacterium]MYB97462.1 hypothetical protein [Gemmatimonadota bacterium]MYI46222.1 hypothetical protein [Gemmatimonadota bacterium]
MSKGKPHLREVRRGALADAPVQPQVASWSVTADEITEGKGTRLDAGSYEPGLTETLDELAAGAKELVPLGDLAHVSLGKWFERVFTDDPEHGVPYCNPTDLLNLMAFGVPQAIRYLSPATNTDIDRLLIREGWLLLTCSGSVSRVFYVGQRLHGWVATHDIVRIVPHDGLTGYIYAWLTTPQAKKHIAGHQHGGVVQHITEEQVAESLVPRFSATVEGRINKVVMRALKDRERAIETLVSAWEI